nr:pentatricopeptide repeat-containing protein At4g21065 [Ipomoea batatas]
MSKIKLHCFNPLHNCIRLIRKLQTLASSTSRGFHESGLIDKNRSLGGLSKSGSVDEARVVFDKMPERDEFTWNAMISAYAETGRLAEARQLFDKAPNKSSITWSTMISGYCKYGAESEGFALFWAMQNEGHRPSQSTLGSILRICSIKCLLLRGEQIHALAIKTGFDHNLFVTTGLVDMYAKCMRVVEAEFVFKMMPSGKNHVTWTAMIIGYSQNGNSLKAIECFCGMRADNVNANQYTFPGVLSACAAVCDLMFGVQVHGCVLRGGFGANLFVQSALVDMYAKCGDLASARKELESMAVNHVVSWNAMILGCVRNGFAEAALSLFKEMIARDIETDNFTYPSVLNSLAITKDVKNGKSVHCLVIKSGYDTHKLVSNALVDMYAKQEELTCAKEMFDGIADKDVVSWTSLVTGCAHNGRHDESLKLFREMISAEIAPDQIIFSSILISCADLAVLEFGQQVHANYIKSGHGKSVSVDNSLITMYAKCGCLEDADRVFNSMHARNVMTWTARIIGYAQNGKGRESVKFYDSMIANGIKPDFIAFIGLLFACSHAGLVELGRSYFKSMTEVYGIKPGPYHYTCMIDLLGRSGKMQEAMELLSKMEVEPDATVWKALLSACGVHGNLDLAEKAAAMLFELEPHDPAPYIMLSNVYSAAGKWEASSRTRRLMKAKGVHKQPSYSWMETNGVVHKFSSEDRNHPRANEVYSKVDEVLMSIKEAGYVPDMNCSLHDINEEGRQQSLAYHSEKLAVAFALLYVPKGAPIRIYKNLRVCSDCHTAMKFISKKSLPMKDNTRKKDKKRVLCRIELKAIFTA